MTGVCSLWKMKCQENHTDIQSRGDVGRLVNNSLTTDKEGDTITTNSTLKAHKCFTQLNSTFKFPQRPPGASEAQKLGWWQQLGLLCEQQLPMVKLHTMGA